MVIHVTLDAGWWDKQKGILGIRKWPSLTMKLNGVDRKLPLLDTAFSVNPFLRSHTYKWQNVSTSKTLQLFTTKKAVPFFWTQKGLFALINLCWKWKRLWPNTLLVLSNQKIYWAKNLYPYNQFPEKNLGEFRQKFWNEYFETSYFIKYWP